MTRDPDPAGPDLEELVAAARDGGEREFEALYRATVGVVYGLCLRLTTDPSLAEECVQQTYIQAWRHLDGFRGDSAVTTWLHRIAVNQVRGHFRRERRFDAEMPLARYVTDPAEGAVALERAIAQLPERARAVFVLVAVYGYPHHEAATMLGIAVGTSKAHYHRARSQLMLLLGEQS